MLEFSTSHTKPISEGQNSYRHLGAHRFLPSIHINKLYNSQMLKMQTYCSDNRINPLPSTPPKPNAVYKMYFSILSWKTKNSFRLKMYISIYHFTFVTGYSNSKCCAVSNILVKTHLSSDSHNILIYSEWF